MPIITTHISDRAYSFLMRKAPGRTGKGLIISELLACEATKEEMREELQEALQAHQEALGESYAEESAFDRI